MPKRIQLSRKKGWRLPASAVSVASPTKYQNPHRPRERSPEANAEAVRKYREHLAQRPDLVESAKQELRGKDLACWCSLDLPCHADVLLEIAAKD